MNKDTRELLVVGSILLLIICLGYIGYATYIDTSLWLPWRESTSTCANESVICPSGKTYTDPSKTCIPGKTCDSDNCCSVSSSICGDVDCDGDSYIDRNKRCGNDFSCDDCCAEQPTCQTKNYECTNGNSVTKPDTITASPNDETCGCTNSDQPTTCQEFNCGQNLDNDDTKNNTQCSDGKCTFDTCCTTKLGKCAGKSLEYDKINKCLQHKTDNECDNKHCFWCDDIQENDDSCTRCDVYFSSGGECDKYHPSPLYDDVFCDEKCTANSCCGTGKCVSTGPLNKIKNSCSDYKNTNTNALGSCTNLYRSYNNTSDPTHGSVIICKDPEDVEEETEWKCQEGHSCTPCGEGYWSCDGVNCAKESCSE